MPFCSSPMYVWLLYSHPHYRRPWLSYLLSTAFPDTGVCLYYLLSASITPCLATSEFLSPNLKTCSQHTCIYHPFHMWLLSFLRAQSLQRLDRRKDKLMPNCGPAAQSKVCWPSQISSQTTFETISPSSVLTKSTRWYVHYCWNKTEQKTDVFDIFETTFSHTFSLVIWEHLVGCAAVKRS